MAKKSKSRKNRPHTHQASNEPHHKHNEPGGPPMGLVAMVAGGLLIVVLGMLFANRTPPSRSEVGQADSAEQADAQVASKAKQDTKAAEKAKPKKAAGSQPHSLLAALPDGASAFGGDAEEAKAWDDLLAKSADMAKARVAVKEAQSLGEKVGEGPGAGQVAAMTAVLQLASRDAAGAQKTIDAALAKSPGDAKETLETLSLQARLEALDKGQRPPDDLLSDMETMSKKASTPATKAAANFHYGRALERLGQADEAVARYQEIADQWPDTTEAPASLYKLGQYWEQKDDPAKALAAYDRVVKEYPSAPEVKRSQQYAGQLRVVGKVGKDVVAKEWINGDPGTLAAGLDGKVVLYLFFASWCPHCRHEMPHMVEIYEKYKDQGLVIVGVTNEDGRQDRGKIVDYIQGEKVPFPIAIQDGRAASQYYAVGGIPAAALVDRAGKIRWRNHPAQGVEDMIKKLLAESGEPS